MSGPSGECYCGVCRICLESLLELEVAASLELHAEVATLRTQLATAEARAATVERERDGLREALGAWKCPTCDGEGKRRVLRGNDAGTYSEVVTCARCDGNGLHPTSSAALKPTLATCFIDGCRESGEHEHSGSTFGPARATSRQEKP